MHNPPVAGVIYGMSHHPYQLEEREKIDEARGDFEKAGVWLRFLQSDRGKPLDDGGKMEILRLIWWFDMSLSMRMGWWSLVFQLNLHGGPSQLDSNINSQCMCSFFKINCKCINTCLGVGVFSKFIRLFLAGGLEHLLWLSIQLGI